MIVFNLACTQQHQFEGWFASGNEFDRQVGLGLVSCPVCGDCDVNMVPAGLHVRRPAELASTDLQVQGELAKLLQGLQQVLTATEDVGEHFAEEVRRMHYEEVPARNVRGVTTLEEAGELLEEGIPVLPLPMPPKSGFH